MATTKENAAAAAEEELVTIRLPRERGLQDDVFVSVNERTWLIKRGVSVQVPKCVAEVLEHQEEMLNEAYDFDMANADKN